MSDILVYLLWFNVIELPMLKGLLADMLTVDMWRQKFLFFFFKAIVKVLKSVGIFILDNTHLAIYDLLFKIICVVNILQTKVYFICPYFIASQCSLVKDG